MLRVTFPAPTILTLESISATQIRILWKDNSSFEKGFLIERKIGTESFLEVQRVGPNVTSWIDSQLDTTKLYTYRIRSFTDINVTDPSNELRANYYYGYVSRSISNETSALCVRLSRDNALIASSPTGNYPPIYLRRTSDGTVLRQLTGHTAQVWAFEFSSNAERLVSSSEDGSLRVWRVSDGNTIAQFKPNLGSFVCLAMSPDESTVAVGGNSGSVFLVRLADGSLFKTLPGVGSGWATSVAFSVDGTLVAGGFGGYQSDNSVRVWRSSDGSQLNLLTGHSRSVNAIALSPDGEILASGGDEGTVRLWAMPEGRLLNTIQAGNVTSLDFSPNGETFVTGSSAGDVGIWRTSDGSRLAGRYSHVGGTYSVVFSLDGMKIVSGGADGIRLWEVRGMWMTL